MQRTNTRSFTCYLADGTGSDEKFDFVAESPNFAAEIYCEEIFRDREMPERVVVAVKCGAITRNYVVKHRVIKEYWATPEGFE